MSIEIVPHEHNQATSIVDYINANNRLEDPTQRRDYLWLLDNDDFLDLVQQIAGLVRTGSAINQSFDGEKAILMGHEAPNQREKEQLLRYTWETAKSFLGDTSLSDEDALDYAALAVAGGLLLAHPFADGNGRTSRALSYMIAKGGANGNHELYDILAKTSGDGNWDIRPIALPTTSRHNYIGNQPEHINWMPENSDLEDWELEIDHVGEDALGGIIVNSLYRDAVIRLFIEKFGDLTAEYTEICSSQNVDGTTSVNGLVFVETLVNNPGTGVSNALALLDILRGLRADYVCRFLDAMLSDKTHKPFEVMDWVKIAATDTDQAERTIEHETNRLADRAGRLTFAQQQLIKFRACSSLR